MHVRSTGTSVAGDTRTLTCTVIILQQLIAMPFIKWVGPNGIVIENETLLDVNVFSPSPLTVILTFVPLRTSHGGEYRCVASVDIAEANVSIVNSSSLNITVQS